MEISMLLEALMGRQVVYNTDSLIISIQKNGELAVGFLYLNVYSF